MSKAARGIPGQRVMSRLLARVATRPAIGPSPAFFARFGLDDPWAGIGGVGGDDARDPLFVFLSAEGYYRDVARQRAARQRLMARFAALEAGPLPAPEPRSYRAAEGKIRTSAIAVGAMSSPVLLAATPAAEPEANETAGRWIERRREPRERVARPVSERSMGRALRREGPSADRTILAALRDAGVETAKGPGRRALASAMAEVRDLSGEGQAEVARRIVRSIRGPSRHAARVAVEEIVEAQESRPLQVALSRQPGAPSRKGLRPVLSASPALVALQHEEPKPVEKAPEARVRRAAAPAAPVVRASAHREAPVALAAREARTQRVTGRAGPADAEASFSEDVPAEAPRRRPTERVARRTQAIGTLPTTLDTRRGFAAVEPAVEASVEAPVRRAVARAVEPQALGGEERLSRSPVVRETRRPRAIAAPVTSFVSAPEIDAAAPAVAQAARRAVVTRASLPAAAGAPTVRAAARSAAATGATGAPRRASLVSAAPTSYLAPAAPESEAIASPVSRRGVQRAVARAVPVARSDERGAPMLSQAPVAHARAERRRALAPVASVSLAAEVEQTQVAPAASRSSRRVGTVAAQPATEVARRVFQRVEPRATAAAASDTTAVPVVSPVATTPTARAALRSASVVSRDGRGARRLAAVPTDYVHISHPEPEVAEKATVAQPRRSVRPAVRLAAREIEAAVPAVAPAAEPRSSTARAARRAAPPVVAAQARRGVLAPVPTAYAVAPEAAEIPEIHGEAPARSQATARAAARADAPVALDERGEGLITRSATAYARPERASRRPLAASPVARLLEPAAAPEIAEATPRARAATRAAAERSVSERPARAPIAETRSPASASRTPAAPVRAPSVLARASAVDDTPVSADAGSDSPARRLPASPVVRAERIERELGETIAAAPRIAATRRVAERMVALALEAEAAESVSSTRAATPARRLRARSSAAEAVPARSMGAAGHALARAVAAATEVSDGDVMRAAIGIVRERSARRRAVRPAMPHALSSSEFRWALPVVAPAESEVGVVRTRQGAASGPVTREHLSGVIGRVAAAVRALERSDRTALVTEGPRRAIADESIREGIAPRIEVGRAPSARRAVHRTAEGVLVLAPVAEAAGPSEGARGAAPRRAVAARGPVVWAERRAAVAPASGVAPLRSASAPLRSSAVRALPGAAPVLLSVAAPAAQAAPGVRLVRRAFAGSDGLAAVGIERAIARTVAPVGARSEGAARFRTQRTAAGTFAPMARAEAPERGAFGLGSPAIPTRRRARVDAATGMVLPEPQSVVAEAAEQPAAGVRRAARPPAPAATAARRADAPARRAEAVARGAAPVSDFSAAPAAEARPWFGTLGELATRADRAAPAARRRPSRLAVDATSGAIFASSAPAPEASDEVEASRPGWVKRAIEGSLALPPDRTAERRTPPKASRVGTSSSLLVALARADHPEEVVQVILERSAQLRTLAHELPGEAGELVGRLVDAGEREGASRASAVAGVAPEQRLLSVAPEAAAPTGSRSRRRPSTFTAGSTQSDMGATKVTKLASKLMNLIHLAEAERKKDHERVGYRMAEDTATARAESSGSAGEKTSSENVNMKALQRDVLEAVLRELELSQQRRQEDPDGRSIWW